MDARCDVAALNWEDKAILLGECTWGVSAMGRSVARERVDRAPLVVPERDWQVHYALLSRAGFTGTAHAEAESAGAQLIDLSRLDADLRQTLVRD